MKPVHELSGPERAAALLVALGPEVASKILRHLDESNIDRISAQIARIEKLSPADREELVGNFLFDLKRFKKKIVGGEGKAREILENSVGREKADEILCKISPMNVEKNFDFLNELDPELLSAFLKDEHPQTIAVTLCYLVPGKSASILQSLSSDYQKSVAMRMAKMKTVSPDAVSEIARVLKKKYHEYLEKGENLNTSDGVDSLVGIFTYLKSDDEKRLMGYFDSSMPEISRQIRDRIFTFENVVSLTNSEVRVLIDEISDDQLIGVALKGAGDDIRFKFMRNMSQNRATDMLNEMNVLGPVRLTEIEDSRGKIVSVMRELNDSGILSLKNDDEIYVE